MRIFTFSGILAWLLALVLPGQLLAQQYLLPLAGTASYTTCGGTAYDDGGPDYAYDGSASGTLTLRPATAGAKLKLAFSYCEVDSVNTGLYIYDGPTTSAPLIGRFYGGRPVVYATGSTGALTLALTSYGLPRRGFAATISCETSAPPPPDLAALSLQLAPTLVPAGEAVAASVRLANLAGGLTAFRVRYLLSADATPSTDDQVLTYADSDLAAGQSASYRPALSVPAATAPGRYYLLAVVQQVGASTEANTANNVAAASLTVAALAAAPDLAITALSYVGGSGYGVAPPLAAGALLTATARYQNLGKPLAARSEAAFFFSTDATLSPDDQLLGQTPVEPTGDRSTAISTSLLVPAGVAPGRYYLLGVADYLDQVIEADEQNNVYATRLTVGPPTIDFTFARQPSARPNQAGPGRPLTVSATVQTLGSVPADSVAVAYYLSADRLPSADDVLLGHDAIGPLAVGSFSSGAFTRALQVPPATPLGKYYLLLVADYRQEVAETDETNNVALLPVEVVTPAVDLTFAGTSFATAKVVATVAFSTRCTLANQGSTTAYPATIGYYLSADQQLSADDVPLNQQQLLPLAGGASQVVEPDLTLPASVAPGSYYLLFVADYQQEVVETNEANNVASVPLQVLVPASDLGLGTLVVVPARVSAGTVAKVQYYLYNQGTTAVYQPTVGFYLSADNLWSPDDAYIGSGRLSRTSLYPASGATAYSYATVPNTTAPGRYYLLGVADPQHEYTDPNLTNNVSFVQFDVTAPLPDLDLLPDPSLTARQVVAGNAVGATCMLQNTGNTDAPAARLGYYLSADPVLDAADVLLGSTALDPLPMGNSRPATGALTVPAATASGRYYVLFVADYLNQLSELSRANNLAYSILTVAATPLAAREQLAGAALLVAPVPVASPAPLRVQLSSLAHATEATLGFYNSLGQLVATRYLALGPGRPAQIELPTAGLEPGVYILRLSGPDLSAARRVVVE